MAADGEYDVPKRLVDRVRSYIVEGSTDLRAYSNKNFNEFIAFSDIPAEPDIERALPLARWLGERLTKIIGADEGLLDRVNDSAWRKVQSPRVAVTHRTFWLVASTLARVDGFSDLTTALQEHVRVVCDYETAETLAVRSMLMATIHHHTKHPTLCLSGYNIAKLRARHRGADLKLFARIIFNQHDNPAVLQSSLQLLAENTARIQGRPPNTRF